MIEAKYKKLERYPFLWEPCIEASDDDGNKIATLGRSMAGDALYLFVEGGDTYVMSLKGIFQQWLDSVQERE